MIFLARRSLLALAAVADVALHARPQPVAAKALAGRLNLPPRHLETLLQSLVRANILKGVRGPRGGYELARERRRISAAEVVRAIMADSAEDSEQTPENRFIDLIVGPIVERAGLAFLTELEGVTIDDICQSASDKKVLSDDVPRADFTI
jgi:Rrf2 family protein